MTITKYNVNKILIDSGSLTDILFYDAFFWMNLSENQLKHFFTPLVGFFEKSIKFEGEITLPVIARTLSR